MLVFAQEATDVLLNPRDLPVMFGQGIGLRCAEDVVFLQIIGEGTLRLDEHKLETFTEKEPFVTKVRLKSPKGFAGGGGVLHVSLHYNSSTAKVSAASVNSSATGGKPSVVGAAEDAAAVVVAAQARSLANGTSFSAEIDRRTRSYDSTGPPAVGAALRPLQHVPENDVVGMDEDRYSQKNGSRNVVDLASLSAVRVRTRHAKCQY